MGLEVCNICAVAIVLLSACIRLLLHYPIGDGLGGNALKEQLSNGAKGIFVDTSPEIHPLAGRPLYMPPCSCNTLFE